MEKVLTTMMTVAVLAVPVGITSACGDATEPADQVPASVDSDQIHDRERRDTETNSPVDDHPTYRTTP